jgi:hypothetical protein
MKESHAWLLHCQTVASDGETAHFEGSRPSIVTGWQRVSVTVKLQSQLKLPKMVKVRKSAKVPRCVIVRT